MKTVNVYKAYDEIDKISKEINRNGFYYSVLVKDIKKKHGIC